MKLGLFFCDRYSRLFRGGNRHKSRPSFLAFKAAVIKARGAAMSEFLVTAPVLLMLGLGTVQSGLMYSAKNTLEYATFESARKGATTHASVSAMTEELGLRIAPLFGGDGSSEKAMEAVARGLIEAKDPRYTRVEILNPTQEAFDDFGVENEDGDIELPNTYLRYRDRDAGPTSKVNIQDANLLKVRITYGYELNVPLVGKLITSTLRLIDADNAQFYIMDRIPISSVAIVRMQSPAILSESVASSTGGGGAIGEQPDPDDEEPEEEDPGDQGEGGNEDIVDDPSDDPDNPDDSALCQLVPENCPDANAGALACGVDNANEFDEDFGTPYSSPVPSITDPITNPPEAELSEALAIPSVAMGNPIHIATGNKVQVETDIPASQGFFTLAFSRTYNSVSVNKAHIMGRGWRHRYQLTLTEHGNGQVSVVQGDGRRLIFDPDENEDGVYRGVLAADGFVRTSASPAIAYEWVRNNGFVTQFDAEGRASRVLAPNGVALTLMYAKQGHLISVKDDQERTLSFEYYPNQRLKKVFDAKGQYVLYRYDAEGNLASVTNREGHTTQYHYENAGYPHHLTGITRENGVRLATYTYDDEGRAVSTEHIGGVGKVALAFQEDGVQVTQANGETSFYRTAREQGIAVVQQIDGVSCDACGASDVRYEFNARLQVTRAVYTSGKAHHYEYDDQNRIIARTVVPPTDSTASPQTLRYAYEGEQTLPSKIIRSSVNPSANHETHLRYNTFGQTLEVTEKGWSPSAYGYEPIERTTQMRYNEAGLLVEIDGPRTDVNDLTQIEYNSKHQITRITEAGRVVKTVLAYDAMGKPTQIESGGVMQTIAYTAEGRVAQILIGDRAYHYTYNETGQLTRVLQPNGQSLSYLYDEAGRRTGKRDSLGNLYTWDYNEANQLVSRGYQSFDQQIHRTLDYLYDIGGKVEEIELDGIRYRRKADQHTETQAQTSAASNQLDGAHALIAQPGRLVTKYLYDAKQQLSAVDDPRDNTTYYAHDDFGRLVEIRSPEFGVVRYTYDAANNVLSEHDADGRITENTYDTANRLLTSEGPDLQYRWEYNDQGRVDAIHSAIESQYYAYNRYGQVTQHQRDIDGFSFVTHYEYNPIGQLVRKILPSGDVLRHHYHEDGPRSGLIRAITKEGLWSQETIVGELNTDRDSSTQQHLRFGNGILRTIMRDELGRVANIDHEQALKQSYIYNEVGQITGVEWQTQAAQERETFVYDRRGRLRQHDRSSSSGTSNYDFDAAGNRTVKQTDSARKLAVYAPDSNKLIGVIADNERVAPIYEYNASGSPVRLGHKQWQYDSRQRLVKYLEGDQAVAEYHYNSFGERVKKVVHHAESEAQTTYYLYENGHLVGEANDDGKVTKHYVYYDRAPVAMLDNGDVYAIHTDHLGTPKSLSDDKQRTVWSATYDPFGRANIASASRLDFNLRLPGQYEDAETGLHYNYHRYYDPDTGRYLTSDPLGQGGGINTYLYANANPVRFTDRFGLQAEVTGASENFILTAATILELDKDILSGDQMANLPVIERRDVYVFNAPWTPCQATPRNPLQLLNAFNQGVDKFTSNGLEVNTLHEPTLIELLEHAEGNPPTNTSHLGEYSNAVRYTSPTDPGREIYQWYQPQDWEVEQLVYGLNQLGFVESESLTGQVMVVSQDATTEDIEEELKSLFGEALDDDVLADAAETINNERVAGIEGYNAESAALVNISDYYEAAMAEYYRQLYTDPSVMSAYEAYYAASFQWELAGRPRTASLCDGLQDQCQTVALEWLAYQRAESAFESALEQRHEALRSAGYLPRHENDQQADESAAATLVLLFDALTLFSPRTLLTLGSKGYAAVKQSIASTLSGTASGLVKIAAKTPIAVQKEVEGFASLMARTAVKFQSAKLDSLLARIPDDTQRAAFRAAYDANTDFAQAMLKNPELVDSWSQLVKAGADDSVAQNVDTLRFVDDLDSSVQDSANALIATEASNDLKSLAATSKSGIADLGIVSSKSYENITSYNFKATSPDIPGITKDNSSGTFVISDREAYLDLMRREYDDRDNPLHPFTESLITNYLDDVIEKSGGVFEFHAGLPGFHAEVQSFNDLIRQLPEGTDFGSFDLSRIQVSTYKVAPSNGQGEAFPACTNCSGILSHPIMILTERKEL